MLTIISNDDENNQKRRSVEKWEPKSVYAPKTS